MNIDLSKYTTKEEQFRFLKDNKNKIIAQKKAQTKHADCVSFVTYSTCSKTDADKSEISTEELLAKDSLKVSAVINTTKLIDSHSDLHIDGLWNKSIKEQRNLLLLQEHKATFDGIISDKVKAKTKNIAWSDLGFDFDGETQALVFDAEIEKSENPQMFERYAKGKVREHSVGMQYVKLELAVNSTDEYYKEEKAVWDKYYEQIANKDVADEKGYFWAVTEAKIKEGSAVVFGSNHATPTLEVKSIEPLKDTQTEIENTEPLKDTRNLFKQMGKKL